MDWTTVAVALLSSSVPLAIVSGLFATIRRRDLARFKADAAARAADAEMRKQAQSNLERLVTELQERAVRLADELEKATDELIRTKRYLGRVLGRLAYYEERERARP